MSAKAYLIDLSYSVIELIADVNDAGAVDSDSKWVVEPGLSGRPVSKSFLEVARDLANLSAGSYFADAVVQVICDVKISMCVDGDPTRGVEGSILSHTIREAELSISRQRSHSPVFADFAHAAVSFVAYIKVAFAVDNDPDRNIKLRTIF